MITANQLESKLKRYSKTQWLFHFKVAKAYKAPNMYQNAEGYLQMVMGVQLTLIHVVYYRWSKTRDFRKQRAWYSVPNVNASLTWFRNDYKDKIVEMLLEQ